MTPLITPVASHRHAPSHPQHPRPSPRTLRTSCRKQPSPSPPTGSPRPPRSPASPQTSPPTPRPASPLTPRPSPPPHQPNLQPAPNPPRSTDLWRSGSPPKSALVRKTTTSAGFGRNHEVFAVADGIGGAPRGDVAATVAVNAAIRAFEEGKPLPEALISANAAVMQICEWLGSPETGSTLLLAARSVTERDRIDLVWVGDSTAFLLHDGALNLLTEPDRLPRQQRARLRRRLPARTRASHRSCARCAGDRVLYAPTACGKRSTRRAWPSSSPQAKTRRG